MIAHVAEAGESRGRVVLRVATERPSEHAITAALMVAKAFNAEIESLFVEDSDLLKLARYSFTREISFNGRLSRSLSLDTLESDMRSVSQALRRRIEAMARAVDVPFHWRVVRDEPVVAIASTCADCGPWNVVVLAEALGPSTGATLAEILRTVADATGIVAIGPRFSRTTGPIVLVLEDHERLPSMLHPADRLAALGGGEIQVLLTGSDETAVDWIEHQARLLLADRGDVRLLRPEIARGEASVVADAIRRSRAGFVLAQFGGLAVPPGRELSILAAALECPLFIVR